jgi:MFS family permease
VLKRLVILASVVVFADMALFSAVTPILPDLQREFDLSKSQAGVLFAAYPLGVLLFAVPSALLGARIGVRPLVVLGLTVLSLASLGVAFATSIAMLDLARFLQGVASASTFTGAFGWIGGAAPRERRGELFGTALGVSVVGTLVGPVIGSLAHEFGRDVVFTATAVIVMALVAVALRIPPAAPEGGSARDLRRAWNDRRVRTAMWLVTLPGLLFGTMAVLVPLRLDELGAGAFIIGGAWVLAGGLEAFVSPLIGRISDRYGRLLPMTFGVAASAVTTALLPWPDAIWVIVLLVVVTSSALGVLWAPAAAMLSDGAERHGVAHAYGFGVMNVGWATGESVGAAGSARLAEATSDAVPYLVLAGVCVLTVLGLRKLLADDEPGLSSRVVSELRLNHHGVRSEDGRS